MMDYRKILNEMKEPGIADKEEKELVSWHLGSQLLTVLESKIGGSYDTF